MSQFPSSASLPAKVEGELAACGSEALFFFRFESDFAGRVKARPADQSFAGESQRRAFTPAVILFIALPETPDNREPGDYAWPPASGYARFIIATRSSATDGDYAHNLLHFLRWWESIHQTGDVLEQELTDSTLPEYLRFQSGLQPRPSGSWAAAATLSVITAVPKTIQRPPPDRFQDHTETMCQRQVRVDL